MFSLATFDLFRVPAPVASALTSPSEHRAAGNVRPIRGRAIPEWQASRQLQARVGSGLNPLVISRLMAQCDAGYPARWHDLLNELRQKDGYLQSVLQTRETALMAAGWNIADFLRPGEQKPSRKAVKRAARVREIVSGIRGMSRAIAHLSDATYKGYSVVEIIYGDVDGSPVPVALEPVAGRRFSFGEDGRLRFFDDGGQQWPGWDFQAELPHKFIVHAPRVNGDVLPREGLGRVLSWYCAFRSWGWRDWLLFAELFGKPITRVEYDRSAVGTDDQYLAEEIANELTGTNRAVHPDSIKVFVEWAKSTGSGGESPCSAIIDRAGIEMALATIGQQLTTSGASGGLGGNGDVRDLVRKDILASDDVQLSETLRDQLIGTIYDFEYGDRSDLAYWTFNTAGAGNTKALLEAMSTGAGLGMKIPVSHAHDVTGWPQAAEGEPALGDTAPATVAATPQIPPQAPP